MMDNDRFTTEDFKDRWNKPVRWRIVGRTTVKLMIVSLKLIIIAIGLGAAAGALVYAYKFVAGMG